MVGDDRAEIHFRQRMLKSIPKIFFTFVGAVLLATAVLKLASLAGGARVLDAPDPLFPFLATRHVFVLAACLELGVVIFLWRRAPNTLKLAVVAWLSSLLLWYRVGLWLVGFNGRCGCLGSVTAWAPSLSGALDTVLKGILGGMFLGSIALLASRRFLPGAPLPPTAEVSNGKDGMRKHENHQVSEGI